MSAYSPFGDYLGFSGSLFSAKTELARKKMSMTEQEGEGDSSNALTPDYQKQRNMQPSESPVGTECNDNGISDSRFRFVFPNIPESGRPILPQKLQSVLDQGEDGLQSRRPSSSFESEESSCVDSDFDRQEILSSTSDVRSSLPRYDSVPEMSATCMGGMMERFVMEVVEKKIRDKFQRPTICVFCQRNGETVEYYSTHVLKDNRGKVICPVLRKYVCPKCNATGDNAHTLRHCPQSRSQTSISETFKTPRTSCGFRKF